MSDEQVLTILKVISNPIRLEILRKIKAGESCEGISCSQAMENVEVSQSTFSHHISELIDSGLVVGKSQGRYVMLSIDDRVWEDFQSRLGQVVFR